MGQISRRSFVKGASVAGAGAAVGTASLMSAPPAGAVITGNIDGEVYDRGYDTVNKSVGQVFDVKAYGAFGDGIAGTTGSISSGSTTFSDPAAAFVSGDIGKLMTVQGAGAAGALLSTTISGVGSPTSVTLAAPAATSAASTSYVYGHDDTAAIAATITASGTNAYSEGRVFAPAGIYLIKGPQLAMTNRGGLFGAGGRHTPGVPDAATVFVCADATAGLNPNGAATYQGFLVDGNNIATTPLQNGLNGGSAGCYATYIDVWSTRSAAIGWTIYGTQNTTYYDCGVTNSATDGLYLDAGAGGLDFFNYEETGSKRYGLRMDTTILGGLGSYLTHCADVRIFGGAFVTPAGSPRPGTSKMFLRGIVDVRFDGVRVIGDNLSGPTVDMDQGNGFGTRFLNCWFTATPGSNRACISVGASPGLSQFLMFIKTDGCSFASGDRSVYIAGANQYYTYSAFDWGYDGTTNGPQAAAGQAGIDTLLMGRTGKWQTATLVSPWTGAVGYRIAADGRVELQGSASGGASASQVFVLGLGYRPNNSADLRIPVVTSAGVGYVTVQSSNTGNVSVTLASGSMGTVSFDGVSFPVP